MPRRQHLIAEDLEERSDQFLMEKIVYEFRPFFFLYFAMAAHFLFPGPMVNMFATLLAGCMGVILWWRFSSRTGFGSRSRG